MTPAKEIGNTRVRFLNEILSITSAGDKKSKGWKVSRGTESLMLGLARRKQI